MCHVGQVRNDATITCYVHLSYARRDRRGFDRLARNFPSVQLSRFEARVQRASTRTSSSIRLFGTEARPGGFAQARASAPPRAVHFDASGLSFVSLPSFQIRVVRRRRARANVVQVAPRRHGHVPVLRRVGFVRVGPRKGTDPVRPWEGMGTRFLSNPDFVRFEPEIVSDQPSVSQPDPSDKVRGSSCQISHVASPPLSRLKPVLPSGTILLRCVVSETRGVRPPPESGARRSEREREGERQREREG